MKPCSCDGQRMPSLRIISHACIAHASMHPGQWAGDAARTALAGGGFRLVVTGHSLGAGVATLLAMQLRFVHNNSWYG